MSFIKTFDNDQLELFKTSWLSRVGCARLTRRTQFIAIVTVRNLSARVHTTHAHQNHTAADPAGFKQPLKNSLIPFYSLIYPGWFKEKGIATIS